MRYHAPYGATDANAPYVNGDPSIGRRGSIPPGEMLEFTQREIVKAIADAGITPSDTDLAQLSAAIQRNRRAVFVVDTGLVNHLQVVPFPAFLAYEQGIALAIKVGHTNTDDVKISVNGMPERSLINQDGTELAPGDIIAGGVFLVVYDGTSFQLESTKGTLTTRAEWAFLHDGGTDTGTTNAYVFANVVAPITEYVRPLSVLIMPAHTNTGDATVNLQGLGVKNIKRGAGSALVAGDIVAGSMSLIIYDGTQFELFNPRAATGGGGGGEGEVDPTATYITGPLAPYWLTVKSATTTAQPGSPSAGDVYLVPTGATGGWSGVVAQIAEYTGLADGWVYRDYPINSIISVTDSGRFLKRISGGWEDFHVPPHLPWSVKSANFNAVSFGAYICNTSGGSFTVTLPASPAEDDEIYFADGGNFALYNLILARNGKLISGLAENSAVDLQLCSFALVYKAGDWRII